jgi:hypothetical protein
VISRNSQTHLSGTLKQAYIKTFDGVFRNLFLGFSMTVLLFFFALSLHASELPQSRSFYSENLRSKPTRSGYGRKNDSP